MNTKQKLSPWISPDGYCAMRVILGSDPKVIANRVAFIEKTPRVRVRPFTTSLHDSNNWEPGPKGEGGAGDHELLEQYGFYRPSREWCDERLVEMGYELT